jgi:hypothetical protein
MKISFILPLTALATSCFASPIWAQNFIEKSHNQLIADGPDKGLNSYELIRKAFGKKAIESPSLYPTNHPGVAHIVEDEDELVGPHFVFLSHRDVDKDRDKDHTDRQRNEIKAYDRSRSSLKGYKGETLQYRWKFKIDDRFKFSNGFTHFFQIKAKNVKKQKHPKDSDKYPILTITGVNRGDAGNRFQLRHSPSLDPHGNRLNFTSLVEHDMSRFTGQWIEFFVQITYEDEGQLIFQAKNVETGEPIIDLREDNIDMWRGEHKSDFSRPKWGIYRSLKDRGSLASEEERARFADFSIRKGTID